MHIGFIQWHSGSNSHTKYDLQHLLISGEVFFVVVVVVVRN